MPLPTLSQRARNTPPSPIRSLSHLSRKAKAAGTKVYHLNIGQPDLESPPEFLTAVKRFDQKVVAYETSEGNLRLREVWSKYMNRSLNLQTVPEQFLITMGASEALVFIFMTCCDPRDEVIIFDPTYANYIGFAAIAGVDLIPVSSSFENNFALPGLEKIVSRITPKTKAVLLCNPNNPTGTVYSSEEIQMLLSLCEERNIFLVVDETYRELVYDGRKPLSVFHLKPDSKHVIVVDSLSKRFSLCGARIGCLLTSNEEVLAKILNLAQARLAAPTIDQHAAAEMLTQISPNYAEAARKEYQQRRDVLYAALSEVPGVTAHLPGGAFYTVVRLPVDNTEKFASFLLSEIRDKEETVFIAPAAGFYMEAGRGTSKARIAYVLNHQSIRRGVELIRLGLEKYVRKKP